MANGRNVNEHHNLVDGHENNIAFHAQHQLENKPTQKDPVKLVRSENRKRLFIWCSGEKNMY